MKKAISCAGALPLDQAGAQLSPYTRIIPTDSFLDRPLMIASLL